jgi:hypothetical protein
MAAPTRATRAHETVHLRVPRRLQLLYAEVGEQGKAFLVGGGLKSSFHTIVFFGPPKYYRV